MVEAEHQKRQRDYENRAETQEVPHWLRQPAPKRLHQMASFSAMGLLGMGRG
jgi:hypothetical protein